MKILIMTQPHGFCSCQDFMIDFDDSPTENSTHKSVAIFIAIIQMMHFDGNLLPFLELQILNVL